MELKLKIIFLFGVLFLNGCDTKNSGKKQNEKTNSISLDNDHKDSFKTVVTHFEYARYKVYGSTIDEFLAENEFFKIITTDFKNINWYQAKVLFNKLDTLKERREMLLIDDKTNFFYAIIPDTGYFKTIPALAEIQMKGEMLGFKLSRDEENPNLEIPNFIILIDSAKVIK